MDEKTETDIAVIKIKERLFNFIFLSFINLNKEYKMIINNVAKTRIILVNEPIAIPANKKKIIENDINFFGSFLFLFR